MEEALQIQDDANQYMDEMGCVAAPDILGTLYFFYGYLIGRAEVTKKRIEDIRDFAPIITDRVH